MGIAEEERPVYDPAPQLRIVDNSPRFAMLWEGVLFDPELTANAKVVYCVLQRMAQEERGTFAPSQAAIAERAGIKDRHTVASCLAKLHEREHIKIEERGEWETSVITLTQPASTRGEKTTIHGEKSPTVRGEKTTAYRGEKTTTLIESNREIERTTANAEKFTPFVAFSAACEEARLDPGGFTEKDRGKHMAVAKRLIADGLTEPDLRGVVRWLHSKGWYDPVTLWTVERRIGEWRAAGRPGPESPRGKPAYRSQADWNAPGQRNADGTLKVIL